MGRLFGGLRNTRRRMAVAAEYEAVFADLQDGLIMADVGAATAAQVVQAAQLRESDNTSPLRRLAAEISSRLRRLEASMATAGRKPFVIMVMGVNGSGKTTTIAKLCRRFANDGQKVLLAAGDTFRAAAREQLQEWADKLGVEVVVGNSPGAVAFDGVQAGTARGVDIVIIDTAGRLPTQANLMAELGKMRRAAGKALAGAPHELLLVLDATLGRNTLRQIDVFSQAAGVTGVVLAKLDGSAKGGFLLEMAAQMPRPVRFVGLGEGADDLAIFDADEYAEALVGCPAGSDF